MDPWKMLLRGGRYGLNRWKIHQPVEHPNFQQTDKNPIPGRASQHADTTITIPDEAFAYIGIIVSAPPYGPTTPGGGDAMPSRGPSSWTVEINRLMENLTVFEWKNYPPSPWS